MPENRPEGQSFDEYVEQLSRERQERERARPGLLSQAIGAAGQAARVLAQTTINLITGEEPDTSHTYYVVADCEIPADEWNALLPQARALLLKADRREPLNPEERRAVQQYQHSKWLEAQRVEQELETSSTSEAPEASQDQSTNTDSSGESYRTPPEAMEQLQQLQQELHATQQANAALQQQLQESERQRQALLAPPVRIELGPGAPKFSGDMNEDVDRWIATLEILFAGFPRWSDEDKLLAAFQQLRSVAQTWYLNQVQKTPNYFRNWAGLKRRLRAQYKTTPHELDVRHELSQLYRTGSMREFVRRHQELTTQIVATDGERQWLYHFQERVRNRSVSNEIVRLLSTEEGCTLDDAYRIATASEHRGQLTGDGRANAKRTPQQPRYTGPMPMEIDTVERPPRNKRTDHVKCFNCNEKGHYASQCPEPDHRQEGHYNQGRRNNRQDKNKRQARPARQVFNVETTEEPRIQHEELMAFREYQRRQAEELAKYNRQLPEEADIGESENDSDH